MNRFPGSPARAYLLPLLLLLMAGSGALPAALVSSASPDDARAPTFRSANPLQEGPGRKAKRQCDPFGTDWPYGVGAARLAVSSAGMVATDAPLATDAGAEVLLAGGNAVDAAVATAFALAVVHPCAGNIGGGGFAVLRTAGGEVSALDFRERAPLASTRDMFLDDRGELGEDSVTGHLAAGVPGSVAGLWELHAKGGSMAWPDLLAPAIRLAEEGFRADSNFCAAIEREADRLARFPASAELFLPGGSPVTPGSTWRDPELAEVLRRIAAEGPDGFYKGETAKLILDEMKRGGGLISREDLETYEAEWRRPVRFDYRGHTIYSMPPPSSGGLTLALIAKILEGFDLAANGWQSTENLHLTAEAMRRAFAYRNQFLGDPDFVDIQASLFTSDESAARLRDSISLARATPSEEVGAAQGGDGTEGSHTTHFSVVDGEGNALALTTTINLGFGSAVTVSGAGFLLNNEMDDFAAKPGSPNAFGLVQSEANAIAPGKRMLSSMTPAIVEKDGRTLLVTGASGGPRIVNGVFQVISNLVDYEFGLTEALYAPRIHHQHLPDKIYYERGGLSESQISALKKLGHQVVPREGVIAVAASILRVGAYWTGSPDPRLGGSARGPD